MAILTRWDRVPTPAGGGASLRQGLVTAVLVSLSMIIARDAISQSAPVTVREAAGVYHVATAFTSPQPAALAHAVLTDYEQIPRFMPDVRTSRILERTEGRVVVEQEGISRFMLFSKRVHLVLEITEGPDSVRFRDRCGRSFSHYEGQWRVVARDGGTDIVYELRADPSFSVPETILKRLLRRDSGRMIESLREEMAAGRHARNRRDAGSRSLNLRREGVGAADVRVSPLARMAVYRRNAALPGFCPAPAPAPARQPRGKSEGCSRFPGGR